VNRLALIVKCGSSDGTFDDAAVFDPRQLDSINKEGITRNDSDFEEEDYEDLVIESSTSAAA
jgi:hypothetical protein